MTRKKKKRELEKRKRNQCLNAERERIAHDIRITRHSTLPSKAIRAISMDRPREMWRINGFTSNRFLLLQFSTLEVMTNKEKEKRRRRRD